MGKKMYYTEEEAAAKLGIDTETLGGYVHDKKLKAYRDGTRRMFKADDVDALVSPGASGTGEIQLAPSETSVNLGAAGDSHQGGPGEVGGATGDGVSIFESDELDIENGTTWDGVNIAQKVQTGDFCRARENFSRSSKIDFRFNLERSWRGPD